MLISLISITCFSLFSVFVLICVIAVTFGLINQETKYVVFGAINALAAFGAQKEILFVAICAFIFNLCAIFFSWSYHWYRRTII